MSLFGSMMGDFDDDPFFGAHIRHMNNMMNSLMGVPFGFLGQNALTDGSHQQMRGQPDMRMVPFGFPPMPVFPMGNGFLPNFENMTNDPNCHSFRSSSVMTMGSGPDGKPQVYQETMSTKTAPGGIKETKKTVSDSRSGIKKMAIGHHIGDRAHIIEKEKNMRNGNLEENQEFINLEEEEAESFNREWETRTRRHMHNAIGNGHYRPHEASGRSRPDYPQLALPDPSGSSQQSSRSRWTPSARRGIRSLPTSKTYDLASSSRSSSQGHSSTSKPSSSSTKASPGCRKREHAPDTKSSNKRHVAPKNDL